MDFAFDDEQEAFRASLRRFLDERSGSERVRAAMESDSGFEAALWAQMAGDLGLPALLVPEPAGGAGFSFLELVIVFEELGRSLACAPLFSTTALATNALLCVEGAAESGAGRRLLGEIASGTTATLALCEQGGGWDPDEVALAWSGDPTAPVIDGSKRFVVDGATAERLLVVARRAGTHGRDGLSLLAVDGTAPGVTRKPLRTLDTTRRQADITFDGTRAEVVGRPGEAGPGLERALARASVCLAAEMVGGAARCLEMAVDYARIRVQFARAIGSFQAIKHKCADLLLEVESARAAAHYAGWAATQEGEDLLLAASLAKACAGDTYLLAATECIQIHGGIGFTWEHDAHLFYKRAESSALMLGSARAHRARIAARLGLDAPAAAARASAA